MAEYRPRFQKVQVIKDPDDGVVMLVETTFEDGSVGVLKLDSTRNSSAIEEFLRWFAPVLLTDTVRIRNKPSIPKVLPTDPKEIDTTGWFLVPVQWSLGPSREPSMIHLVMHTLGGAGTRTLCKSDPEGSYMNGGVPPDEADRPCRRCAKSHLTLEKLHQVKFEIIWPQAGQATRG